VYDRQGDATFITRLLDKSGSFMAWWVATFNFSRSRRLKLCT